ncbi:hypothetical protein D3C71_1953890 [compost metagenome]
MAHSVGVFGEVGLTKEDTRLGDLCHVGHVVGHQAEIGGHPNRTDAKGRKHRLEHFVAVLAVHQHCLARLNAEV